MYYSFLNPFLHFANLLFLYTTRKLLAFSLFFHFVGWFYGYGRKLYLGFWKNAFAYPTQYVDLGFDPSRSDLWSC